MKIYEKINGLFAAIVDSSYLVNANIQVCKLPSNYRHNLRRVKNVCTRVNFLIWKTVAAHKSKNNNQTYKALHTWLVRHASIVGKR